MSDLILLRQLYHNGESRAIVSTNNFLISQGKLGDIIVVKHAFQMGLLNPNFLYPIKYMAIMYLQE